MQCFEQLLQRRQTEIRFVNSPLSSLFSELTLSLNAETISITNANFTCKSFIVTEFSFYTHAKKLGWHVKVIFLKKTHQLLTVMEE